MYESIIIGGGPSGLTAALYLSRFKRKTLMIAESIGGQTAIAGNIENYPGFESINGLELVDNIKKQVNNFKQVEILTGKTVVSVKKEENKFIVATNSEKFESKTIIIATGKRHRKLGLNEEELIGRGVSYCATCDGPFAKDKDVIIVGGGYAAVEGALLISKHAKSIKMLVLDEDFDCEQISLEKIIDDQKIDKLFNTQLIEIICENEIVSGAKIKNLKTGKVIDVNAQMIFVEIGHIPNSEIFDGFIDIKNNEIIVDSANKTSENGVFACGDVTNIEAKQTVVACGEGAKAAISVNKFLHNNQLKY